MEALTPNSRRHLPIRDDCWTENATSTLVDLRQKDWQDVAHSVNSLHGLTKKTHRTDVQCKNRIDTVKKKYKTERARVSASRGAFVSSWPFYARLHELIDPTVKPPSQPPLMALPLQIRKSSPPVPAATPALLPRSRNYSAMAAAAALTEDEDEVDEEEEEAESSVPEQFGGLERCMKEWRVRKCGRWWNWRNRGCNLLRIWKCSGCICLWTHRFSLRGLSVPRNQLPVISRGSRVRGVAETPQGRYIHVDSDIF